MKKKAVRDSFPSRVLISFQGICFLAGASGCESLKFPTQPTGNLMRDTLADRIDSLANEFESSCKNGQSPRIDLFLEKIPETERKELRRELVRLEFEYDLRAGKSVRVEDYLSRHPELATERETVVDLIALEYSHGLSAAEAQELDALQDVVSKTSEPEDRRLLKLLDDREQRANSPSQPCHE